MTLEAQAGGGERCEGCGAQLEEVGSPIWETYCPNPACTFRRDQMIASIKARVIEERRADQVKAAAPQLLEALKGMVYETTHLSPCKSDGSHECRISRDALSAARAAIQLAEGR